ncbi:hypothetical protein Tco_0371786 [Tanacetum coccineum]
MVSGSLSSIVMRIHRIPVGIVSQILNLFDISLSPLDIQNARVGIQGCYHRTGVYGSSVSGILICFTFVLKAEEVWNELQGLPKVHGGFERTTISSADALLLSAKNYSAGLPTWGDLALRHTPIEGKKKLQCKKIKPWRA